MAEVSKYKNKDEYVKQMYDRVNLKIRKGNKDVLKAYAESKQVSVNVLINAILAENVPDFIPFSNDYISDYDMY